MPGPMSGTARDTKGTVLSKQGSPSLEPSPRVDAMLKGKAYYTGKTDKMRGRSHPNRTNVGAGGGAKTKGGK